MEKLKAPKLRYANRFQLEKKDIEKKNPKLRSLTVPDQTMSLKDIVKKFVMRQEAAVTMYEGVYHLDDESEDFDLMDMEKFSGLDITERTEIAKEAARKTADLKRRLHQQENLAAQKKREEEELQSRIKKDFLEKQKSGAAAGADDSAASAAKGGKE